MGTRDSNVPSQRGLQARRSVWSDAGGHGDTRSLVSPKPSLLPSKLRVPSQAGNGSLPGESRCSCGTAGHVHGVLAGHKHVSQNFLFGASPEAP